MTRKGKALGRGLESLLPNVAGSGEGLKPSIVDVDLIDPNPFQPRMEWNREELESLAFSIKSQGILQPLVLRKKGSRYQLIAGERRLRAAKHVGLKEVPAVLREATDRQMLALALVENIHRRDLGPIEKGEAFKKLANDFDLTQEELGRQVGLSRSAVTNFIRLLDLPGSVKDLLRSGKISMGHGRALLGLEDPIYIKRLADNAARKNISVRQLEEIVRGTGRKTPAGRQRKKLSNTPEIRELEEKLQRRFKTRVKVIDKGGKGRIVIEYHSLEELDGVLETIFLP